MIEIRLVDREHEADARLPNQPFLLWGRMIPELRVGQWSYHTETFVTPSEMCFPDYPYEVGRDDSVFLGAYDGDRCVGLAVLREAMFRYLYLDDLKVAASWRGRGIGGRLVEACMAEAAKRNKLGVYTVGQDNNLTACLFYLRQGFEIGGFDNRAYRGTPQEHKADIYFYRDCCPELSGEQDRQPERR